MIEATADPKDPAKPGEDLDEDVPETMEDEGSQPHEDPSFEVEDEDDDDDDDEPGIG